MDSHIQAALVEVCRDQKVSITRTVGSSGSQKGDNYQGVITKIEVHGKDDEDREKILNFVIKQAPDSKGLRDVYPIHLEYRREIAVYKKILPEFVKFQKEKNVKNPFTSFARCYHSSSIDLKEFLIMNDLSLEGYKMADRLVPLNLDYLNLMIKELGRLHALSFALKDQKPELYAELVKEVSYCLYNLMNGPDFREEYEDFFGKSLESLDLESEPELVEKFLSVKGGLMDGMYECYRSEMAGEYQTIVHGDCWINNCLFLCEDPEMTKPTSLYFLDWQFSHQGSPLLDIYFVLSGLIEKDVRNNHFEDLLELYYSTLSNFLAELGSDADEIYPRKVFELHKILFAPFGLGIGHLVNHFQTCRDGETPDYNEELGGKSLAEVNSSNNNVEAYRKAMHDVIEFFVIKGLI